jgi:hypothetical protein
MSRMGIFLLLRELIIKVVELLEFLYSQNKDLKQESKLGKYI